MIRIDAPELNKLPEENERQYLYRLGNLYNNLQLVKLDGFTRADWNDLAELMNSQCRDEDSYFTESVYRKRYCEMKACWAQVFKNLKDEEVITELDVKARELQKERYKLQATKVEMTRNLRHESRFDLLYENVREAIRTLPMPVLEPVDWHSGQSHEYVLTLSDIHYSARFTAQNNKYDTAECRNRFGILLSAMKEYVSSNNINNIKIINIADNIQGILRISDLVMNEVSIVTAVVEVSRLIAEFLNQLSAVCNIEYYHCSSSNHGQLRPLGSKASELAAEDMEHIILNYISDLLVNNDRVTVIGDLDKEYLVISIFDYKAIALHGHQIKNVTSAIKDLSNLHRTFYNYAFLGHRHTSNEITVGEDGSKNVEVLNCPSFVGSCPFADRLLVGSKAAAKVYVFDQKFGHVESKTIILN